MAYIPPSDRPQGEQRTRQQLAHLVGQIVVVEGDQSGYKQDSEGRFRYVCLANTTVYQYAKDADCLKQPSVKVDHLWLDVLAGEDDGVLPEHVLHQHAHTLGIGVVSRYKRRDGSRDYGVMPILGQVVLGYELQAYKRNAIYESYIKIKDFDGVLAFVGIDRKAAEKLCWDYLFKAYEVHDAYQRRIFGKGEGNRQERRAKAKRCRRGVKPAGGFGYV